MMWFDILGNSLAFVGSIIISADLLKGREQVQDENATYFDANPFTTKSGIESIPAYVIAFFLIVTGFAITLGGNIGEAARLSLSGAILVCSLTAFNGYIFILFMYLVNKRRHRIAKAKLKVKIFYTVLKDLAGKYEAVIGQHNETALFAAYKPSSVKNLQERLEDMPTLPEQHMRDIIAELSKKRTASTFKRCIEGYLREHGPSS